MFSIEVVDKDILKSISDFYKVDGRLFFDGCDSVAYSKKITELKDGNIESSFVIPDAFNMTKKNKAIFALKKEDIDILLLLPNESISKTIYVKKKECSSKKIFVVYSNDLGNLSKLKLKDVDMGTFTFNEANMLSNFTKAKYEDGDLGYWFGLCDYGGWAEVETDPQVGISTHSEDFRPLFSPLHLLKKGFAEIGYSFESELYESEFGRRQWRYLSHNEFAPASVVSNSILVSETNSSTQTRNGDVAQTEIVLQFDNAILDAEGFGSNDPGVFTDHASFVNFKNYPVDVEVYFSDTVLVTSADLVIAAAVNEIGADILDRTYTTIASTSTTGSQLIEGFVVVTIPSGHFAYIALDSGAGTFSTDIFGSFQVVEKGSYMPSTTIQVNCAIDPELDFGRLLKAEMQLFNAVLEIDETARIAKMLPSENANVFGERIKGRITPKPLVKDEIQNPVFDSETIEYLKNEVYLYELYFQESNDAFIEGEREAGRITGRLWGKEIEVDVLRKNKKDSRENELYEPTINAYPSKQVGQSVFLPHIAKLTDNLDGELSKDIGYRCFIGNYGTGTIDGKNFNFKFEGTGRTNVPLTFQYLPKNMTLDAVWFNRQNLIFNQNLTIFQTDDNLLTIFYPRLANSEKIRINKKYLLNLLESSSVKVGEWRVVTADGVSYSGIVTAIDYQGEGKQEVTVTFAVH